MPQLTCYNRVTRLHQQNSSHVCSITQLYKTAQSSRYLMRGQESCQRPTSSSPVTLVLRKVISLSSGRSNSTWRRPKRGTSGWKVVSSSSMRFRRLQVGRSCEDICETWTRRTGWLRVQRFEDRAVAKSTTKSHGMVKGVDERYDTAVMEPRLGRTRPGSESANVLYIDVN